MKINVIHIIDSLKAGGAETIAVNTVNSLNSDGNVNAYLCATREEGALKNVIEDNSKYIYLKKRRTFDQKAIQLLQDYIKENDIEYIHAHSTSFFIAYLIKLRLKYIKLIWHNHSGANVNLRQGRLWILKKCAKSFSAIISVNDALNTWSKKQLKFANSYKLNNFAIAKNDKNTTQLLGKSEVKIVCVAGFRKEKDHLNLLKAFHVVLNNFPDSSLHLVGKDYDDDYSISVKQFIVNKSLQEKVYLYGSRLDINHILSQATIGVLSSKSEGLPISLLEYGLASIPVVVTNVGDCAKVVENDISGLVVEKENEKELANALTQLISNKSNAQKLGVQLKQKVEENYSREEYINQLIAIYNSL